MKQGLRAASLSISRVSRASSELCPGRVAHGDHSRAPRAHTFMYSCSTDVVPRACRHPRARVAPPTRTTWVHENTCYLVTFCTVGTVSGTLSGHPGLPGTSSWAPLRAYKPPGTSKSVVCVCRRDSFITTEAVHGRGRRQRAQNSQESKELSRMWYFLRSPMRSPASAGEAVLRKVAHRARSSLRKYKSEEK